ncbi:MAG: hypothetical protein HYX75_21075 [Acidobacteria bacterium]|nr:hypothetical protein [Acidobacteriota bacterium]
MMSALRLHATFGLIMLVGGILFDFFYLQTRMSAALRTDLVGFLTSFERHMLELTKNYTIIFGLIHILLGTLSSRLAALGRIDWIVFWLTAAGSLTTVATGFWYVRAGPALVWELRCTVLTAGLIAFVSGLAVETYRVARSG